MFPIFKRLFALFLLAAALTTATFAQTGVIGKVVEVLDARTLVLETSAGRVTVRLQYVEVLEEGQPLYAITRDHLSRLALGKSVEYKTLRIIRGDSIARITTFEGIDLSLQMIRDGAAWHEPRSTSGQPESESADYEANQALAKNEKRGVWSVPNLKTPWEVRTENDRTARVLEVARRLARPTRVGVGQFHSDTRRPSGNHTAGAASPRSQMDAWVNVFAGAEKEPHGLLTYSDPKGSFTGVYTSAALLDFVSPAGKERLECRALMIAPTVNGRGRNRFYLLAFRAISSDYRFSKGRTRLTVVADTQRIALGAPFGFRGNSLIGAEELMYFQLTWAQLKKIGNAKKVTLQIDRLSAPLSEDSRSLFKELASATV
jgi:endonuclease YncB( thermonuclease family)